MIEKVGKSRLDDEFLSWILVGTVLVMLFRTTILLQLFDDTHFLVSSCKYLIALLFALGIKVIFKRSCIFTLKAYTLCFAIFASEFLLFPENSKYLTKDLFFIFAVSMPMLIYAYSIHDCSVFLDTCRNAIPFAVCIGVAYCCMVLYLGMAGYSNSYNMSAGFYLMIFALACYDVYFRERRFLYLFAGVLLTIIITAVGSRGPILWIVLYVYWQLMRRSNIDKIITVNALLVVVAIFFNEIISLINEVLADFNIHSRTLYLLENNITSGSGRWELYAQGMQIIEDNWFTGAGMGCDRAIHSYVHNFFLEIWMDFGILLGTLFMIIFFALLIYAYKKADKVQRNCLIFVFWLSFLPLLLSGSYYTDFRFYIFIGIVLGLLSAHRRNIVIRV